VRAILQGRRGDERLYHSVRGSLRPREQLIFGDRSDEGRAR
jgi:hypothetical protein